MRRASRHAGRFAFSAAALSILAFGCGRETASPVLRIYSAASFADAAADLATEFGAEPFTIVPGPSNALARQLEDGAPGDLFFTADPRWLEWLERGDQTLGIRRTVAANVVVCIAPADSALALAPPADAAALIHALDSDARVAITSDGVPAGEYARQALKATGAMDALAPHLVGLRDVRAVLRAVEAGEVAAGFVYRTDALAGDVIELFAFAPGLHDEALVVGVALQGSAHSARALELLEDMQSAKGKALLQRAGFQPADDADDRR